MTEDEIRALLDTLAWDLVPMGDVDMDDWYRWVFESPAATASELTLGVVRHGA